MFTRQFTAFDRHNASAAESPFHGFYAFFWLGVAIYMIRLAMENWRQYGHVLGSNEIMQLAFRRDVLVLLISDGMMCGFAFFSLALQKVVFSVIVDWGRSAWIVQSVG